MKDSVVKTVFITGGNSGIGLSTAEIFARNGFNVVIFSRDRNKNEEAIEHLSSLHSEVLGISGDVSNETDVRNALKQTVDQFGRLDFAFNNAGLAQRSRPLTEQTLDEYESIMDVNVKGVWLCMREQVKYMLEVGGGCIVNSCSVSAHRGVLKAPLYTAAKHSVLGLTRAVAIEYARQGIRVNAISPAYIKTQMMNDLTKGKIELEKRFEQAIPMGRAGKPEEIAKTVYFICTESTWMTGECVRVDGGFTA